MNSFRSRLSTLFLPIRIATTLGKGWIGSRERREILSTSYKVLLSIAQNTRTPAQVTLWFRGTQFQFLLESSADFALLREVFLDEEYRHVEIKNCSHIFDVGANVGAASIYFYCLYPEATIYAFEPDPLLFEKLSAQVAAIPTIMPLQMALSDKDGMIAFYRHAGSPLAGSLLPRASDAVPVQVPTRTISSIANELTVASIDLLKFDIEGAERMLFASYEDRIRAQRIIGEAHLDLLSMTREEFAELFDGFTFEYSKNTAPDRYIVWAEKNNSL